ncbi:CmpA/NrtA family ABC transporter substrate-binding protein [Limoniibacter endophyticus]|uniref:Nitrate transporter n=1 Tax=Limoniibacter endophyticus TaxID=1565040 RepID=A0A8J3GIK1_9HYPH|nr:CmpA/NrtA family ABC transporter substrate-binding protein [Limoniibacter endophyticus]GHC72676.1 nitrate transporter [Limoniibacter endophyticus]
MSLDHRVSVGFLPLLDSAILVAAREKGFAEAESLDLVLVRENSWASIRDRLAVGHFAAAHMLGPMPIAFNLGLAPLAAHTIAPMALGLGGNAVTVSRNLWTAMEDNGASSRFDPASAGKALREVIAAKAAKSRPRFAVVHPHSGHNYELRYWLSASGIDPERDVEIVVVPPPLMQDALAGGRIEGYCVGEPYNSAAALAGIGRIITLKSLVWRSSPEKVLGVAANWADANPEALGRLLRALYRAAEWCGTAANHGELAEILARPGYIGCPAEWLLPALSGNIPTGDGQVVAVDDFFVPHKKAATFPWKSHALWFYSQMVRWGQIEANTTNEAVARESYRPDLYRTALGPIGVALPGANAKVEGALTRATPVGSAGASLVLGPDGFFDGKIFDPDRVGEYIGK